MCERQTAKVVEIPDKTFGDDVMRVWLSGFTLIELLVVVLIIGILSAVALPQYRVAVAKSRFVQLQTLGTAIQQAEERYLLSNAEYTQNFRNLDLPFPGELSAGGRSVSFKDFVCTLSFEAGPGLTEGSVINYKEVVCHYQGTSSSSRQNVPLFIYSFHTQKAYCRAYDISPVQARVCQSDGGGKDSSYPGGLWDIVTIS